MKISKLIENLQAIQKEFGDLDCIYAKDDEGNGFNYISYNPSVGEYDSKGREFYQDDEEYEITVNAVCVN